MRKFLIAALAATAAIPVLAQSTAPVAPIAPVPPVARVAPMADKIVTRAEVDAKVREHFARADANRDGFVTSEEMSAGRKHAGKARRVKAARDPNAAFDRVDSNKDGMISRDEFARGRETRMEKRHAMRRDGAGRHAPMGMRLHRMGGMMGARMIKMADANNDGRVSLGEATAGAARHFDLMDSNRDGRITPEERRAGRLQMRRMHLRQAS